MTVEVLEQNFLKLKQKLMSGDVRTLDEVMKLHQDYLDECLKECLLTDQNFFRIVTKLNQTNNFFARVVQRQF
jgi:gamma-tubulin complex component 2